jgi:serine/threonine protein kinase
MALTPGTKLGPYEISAAIGAGGMGEVYRARDSRLNRDVAIKILPSSFSSDPERLHRFQQEALAAAALNHPNILAVYDIGTEGGAPYIVSELLEGETLRERVRSGPLPVRKATEYAIQIAQGLAAAHDKGIIHRDLKPENVFVTGSGRIKLLDFGLAKLTQPAATPEDSETRTIHSDAHVLLGTVGYISPEQVRGKPADARSDIFAFGAVLYEMISGKRAFHGETSTDTMSAILHGDPPELTATNRNVPPALERIVRHCLEKNPAERFHSAHDVAFDLETLSSISSGTVSAQIKPGWKRQLPLFGVLGLLVLVGIATYLAGKYSSHAIKPVHFTRISFERGMVVNARFAPDGNSVFYDAGWEGNPTHLYSTPATVPEPRLLDLNANLLAVSRTGEAALALRGRLGNHMLVRGATLARSPLGGGAPRELLDEVQAAEWSADGNLAVAHYVNGKVRLEYPIGKILYETGGWITDIRFSPAGDKIAFLDHVYWPDDRGSVAVIDLAGNKKQLTGEFEAEDGLAWSPDGKEVWFTAAKAGIERILFAVTLSGKQRLLLSVPATLRLFDVYPDGRVLLAAGHERVNMMATTPDGKSRDLSWSGWTIIADVSHDGKQVLFDEQSEFAGTNYAVAIRGIDGSPPIKLGDGELAKFSPDGKSVGVAVPGQPNHFLLLPTAAGEAKDIPVSGLDVLQRVGFLPDGRVFMVGSEPGHGIRCFVRALEGGSMKAATGEGVLECRSSLDSRQLAVYQNGDLWVYDIETAKGYAVPGAEHFLPIRWLDNHTILAAPLGEIPSHVFQIDSATGKKTLFRELEPGDRAGVYQMTSLASSPDGKTIVYSYHQAIYDLYVVEGLK